ncbi:MAG: hypothetical protein K0M63_06850 [Weeksellaceae bacterium]|nr:hypothetical protein [Weeksellaceae bacterium]
MSKLIILLFSLAFWTAGYAQENTLLKILNRELKKEIKNQLKSPHFNGDTIRIIQPFTINSEKILSLEIEKRSPYLSSVWVIKQEVPLNAVKKVGKDINIILETGENLVTTTSYRLEEGKEKEEQSMGNLFFLYLSNEKQNEDLGIAIQNAFIKAGVPVIKEYWYD